MPVYCLYVIPAYFLAKLQSVENDYGEIFLLYAAMSVLHSAAWRYIAMAFALLHDSKVMAVFGCGECVSRFDMRISIVRKGALLLLLSLVDGVTLYNSDQWWLIQYLRIVSPNAWASAVRFSCFRTM